MDIGSAALLTDREILINMRRDSCRCTGGGSLGHAKATI
jgi:hypothetical protein